MKKLTTLLTLFFLMSASYLFSQEKLAIAGKVLDDKNQQPVAYANVSLYNLSDSSLVKGANY
jgi:hypothetical protein